jgi:hypothetical protein
MIWLRNIPSLSPLSIRSPQVLMLSLCWFSIRMLKTLLGNTRHVQVIRQNFVASTTANPSCCCDLVYCLGTVGMHQPVLTVLGSSSSKLSLPCLKCLCHLNTALRPKASSLYACIII